MVSYNFNIRRFVLEFSQSFNRTHPNHPILALGHRCCAKDPTGIFGALHQGDDDHSRTWRVRQERGFLHQIASMPMVQNMLVEIIHGDENMFKKPPVFEVGQWGCYDGFCIFGHVKKTGSPCRLSMSAFDRKVDLKTIKTGCWKKVCSLQRCIMMAIQKELGLEKLFMARLNTPPQNSEIDRNSGTIPRQKHVFFDQSSRVDTCTSHPKSYGHELKCYMDHIWPYGNSVEIDPPATHLGHSEVMVNLVNQKESEKSAGILLGSWDGSPHVCWVCWGLWGCSSCSMF